MLGGSGEFEETDGLATSEGVGSGVDGEEVTSVIVVVLGAGEAGDEGAVEGVELGDILLGIALVQQADEGAERLLKVVNVDHLVQPIDGAVVIADGEVVVGEGAEGFGVFELGGFLPAGYSGLQVLGAAVGSLSMSLGAGAQLLNEFIVSGDVSIVVVVESIVNFGGKQSGGVHV